MSAKKLHLGSGGMIIPGFINTDYDEMEGVDMVLDASKVPYPFESNSLDEVFSAHMIEHIKFSLIQPMIHEWFRILKPGGKVIAEIPDLKGACELYLKGERDVSLKVFYGLQEERETQEHKWGYTFKDIRPLFVKVGFSSIEEKPTLDYHWHNFGIPTFRLEATK